MSTSPLHVMFVLRRAIIARRRGRTAHSRNQSSAARDVPRLVAKRRPAADCASTGIEKGAGWRLFRFKQKGMVEPRGIEPLTRNHWKTKTFFLAVVTVGIPKCNT